MLFLHLVDIKGTLILSKHGLKRLLLVLLLFFVLLVEIKGRLVLTRQGVVKAADKPRSSGGGNFFCQPVHQTQISSSKTQTQTKYKHKQGRPERMFMLTCF